MTKKQPDPQRISTVAWRCPCGLEMGLAERPVCVCGEWTLDGPAEKAKPEGDIRLVGERYRDKPEPEVEAPASS